ncbi:uncharacterized protein [Eucyclogobius newberryi]|uniref:uncharacterized protein n=1 Tax=Eucyclogobius newberryi TaxID=166745 RepID=UPI003B58DC9E
MKLQMLLPISLVVSLGSFALMKIRVKDLVLREKQDTFLSVKLRVVQDMVTEYHTEMAKADKDMESGKAAQALLQKEMPGLNTDTKKSELDMCLNTKKLATDEVGSLQEQAKTFQDESTKERTAWEAEIATLNEKLTAQSPICNYLKPGSSVKDFCPEKKEETKAAEKKDEGKADSSNPDAPKPDAPKPDAPKPDAPKPDAPKQDAPKPDAPKQDAPKQDAPKQDAPKQDAPKQDAPNPDAPKQDAPNPDAPKQEAPKQEAPKQEAPKQDAPNPDAPKQDAPKQDAPNPDAPKQEAPKQDAPK